MIEDASVGIEMCRDCEVVIEAVGGADATGIAAANVVKVDER